jgi:hypothetical protein
MRKRVKPDRYRDDPTDQILTAAGIFRQATGEESKSGPLGSPAFRSCSPSARMSGQTK